MNVRCKPIVSNSRRVRHFPVVWCAAHWAALHWRTVPCNFSERCAPAVCQLICHPNIKLRMKWRVTVDLPLGYRGFKIKFNSQSGCNNAGNCSHCSLTTNWQVNLVESYNWKQNCWQNVPTISTYYCSRPEIFQQLLATFTLSSMNKNIYHFHENLISSANC